MAARAPRIDPRRAAALGQVRQVIERLVHDGTVVARSDGTVHDLFPVAVGAAEGAALREWVVRERATRTIEIGLAFVDGDHRFDGVFLDLVFLGRLLRPGAVVVVDDYQLPAVARAVSFCVTNLGWRSEVEF